MQDALPIFLGGRLPAVSINEAVFSATHYKRKRLDKKRVSY
jgi:hypothetical protein